MSDRVSRAFSPGSLIWSNSETKNSAEFHGSNLLVDKSSFLLIIYFIAILQYQYFKSHYTESSAM